MRPRDARVEDEKDRGERAVDALREIEFDRATGKRTLLLGDDTVRLVGSLLLAALWQAGNLDAGLARALAAKSLDAVGLLDKIDAREQALTREAGQAQVVPTLVGLDASKFPDVDDAEFRRTVCA